MPGPTAARRPPAVPFASFSLRSSLRSTRHAHAPHAPPMIADPERERGGSAPAEGAQQRDERPVTLGLERFDRTSARLFAHPLDEPALRLLVEDRRPERRPAPRLARPEMLQVMLDAAGTAAEVIGEVRTEDRPA